MFCSTADPIVNDAFNKGLINGPQEEVQTLVELLNIACNHSDIAKSVIYEAFHLGTKIFLHNELHHPFYKQNRIHFRKSFFQNIKWDLKRILLIGFFIHEARHACQFSLLDRTKEKDSCCYSNWVNLIMHKSLIEADASSIEVASKYEVVESSGMNSTRTRHVLSRSSNLIYGHFVSEYEKHHDMRKALDFTLRMANWKLCDEYKSLYIKKGWCCLNENATVIHPNEWVRLLNLTYKNEPYMNIQKMTRRSLCLKAEDYLQLEDNLKKEQKKDDSLKYFSIKVPKEYDEQTQRAYEIIPARKYFEF